METLLRTHTHADDTRHRRTMSQALDMLAANPSIPHRTWGEHFRSQQQIPEIARPHLVARVLGAPTRWVNIAAMPGMGRTTLLHQLAAELRRRGDRIIGFWSPRQTSTAIYDLSVKSLEELRSLEAAAREFAASNPSRMLTVIMDDLDLTDARHHIDMIVQQLDVVPELRFITSTYNPIKIESREPSPFATHFAEVRADRAAHLTQLTNGDLAFTAEESRELCALAANQLDIRGLDERVIDLVHETTRGVPLGAALKIDRLQHSGSTPGESGFSCMLQAVHTHLRRTYPSDVLDTGFSRKFDTLALMPRFTGEHVTNLFPGVLPDLAHELVSHHLLDPKRSARAGEYVWCSSFWHASTQWNLVRSDARFELANRLHEQGDICGAFEQWFLAGDFARAERVLRSLFLTIHETITPETAREICDTPSARLRGMPLLLSLQTLLDPHTEPHALDICAENLRRAAERHPGHGVIPLAVRASVLSRRRLGTEAIAQARQVLERVEAERIAAEAAGSPLVDDTDESGTATAALSRAEAALIATLTLLACETYPEYLITLPGYAGSHHLSRRRALAQQVLDALRLTPRRQDAVSSSQLPAGYRSLVYSVAQCMQEVMAYEEHDRAVRIELDAHSQLPQNGEPMDAAGSAVLKSTAADSSLRVPYVLSRFARAYNLLLAGNIGGAIEIANSMHGTSPYSELLQCLLREVTGHHRDALQALDAIGAHWGTRIDAVRRVFRANALQQLGNADAAQQELIDAERIPDTALARALSLLPEADGRALSALTPRFSLLYSAAAAVGALGSHSMLCLNSTVKPLTKKERTVLEGLKRGLNTREIADEGFLSVNTVRSHVRSVSQKLGASGHAEILRRARELGMLE